MMVTWLEAVVKMEIRTGEETCFNLIYTSTFTWLNVACVKEGSPGS